jgi:hypothetical protein
MAPMIGASLSIWLDGAIKGWPMMVVSKGSYPKRLQTGEYDSKILCAKCDNHFASWEKYTADLLGSRLN